MKRKFLIAFAVGMALIIGLISIALMSGCIFTKRRVRHFEVGYYEKAYIHVPGRHGGLVTFEAEGPGYSEQD